MQQPWTTVSPEEAQLLRQEAGSAGAGLRVRASADISAGHARHPYCSRAVPDVWLALVDHALAAQTR